MDVLRLVTIFKGEVLEERVCGEWGGKECRGEEAGGIREDSRLGLREEEGSERLSSRWWWF